jgi:hypothetical protein
MVLALDEAFRQSTDYKEWMDSIMREHPRMPKYLAECAIMCHLADPQAYKKLKNAPIPERKPLNPASTVIEGAVSISPPPIKDDSSILSEAGPDLGSIQVA